MTSYEFRLPPSEAGNVRAWESTESVGSARQYVTRLEVAVIGCQKRDMLEGSTAPAARLGSFTRPTLNPIRAATSSAMAIGIQRRVTSRECARSAFATGSDWKTESFGSDSALSTTRGSAAKPV